MSKLGLELFDAFKWTAEDDEALRDAFDKHQVCGMMRKSLSCV